MIRRNSSGLPPKVVEKSKSTTHTHEDLLYKYIEKLNEVIEENKALEQTIREKEKMIIQIKKFPLMHIDNYYCRSCERILIENEDLLMRIEKRAKEYKWNLSIDRGVGLVIKSKRQREGEYEIKKFDVEIIKIKENKNEINKIIKVPTTNIPNVPKMPTTNIPNVPKMPTTNLPNVPKVSNIPNIPNTPKVPTTNIPNVPKVTTTNIPNVPKVPTTNLPKVQNAPNITNIPNIPKVPNTPNIPNIPKVPNTPNIPNTPKVPNTPNIPNTPKVPNTPNIPNMPNITNIPKIPTSFLSDTLHISGNPSLQAPKLPSTSSFKFTFKKLQIRLIPTSQLKNTFWSKIIKEIELPKYLNSTLIDKNFSLITLDNKIQSVRKDSVVVIDDKKLISLLDDKRSRQISIILSRFKISSTEIFRILNTFDTDTLGMSEIEFLMNMLPNQEEENILKNYKGDVNELAKPEKYLIKFVYIPRCGERVKFIEYINKFTTAVSFIKEDLKIMKVCLNTIKESENFKQIFVICLAIANYINNTQIMGMSLESFNSMISYTSNDKKSNLPNVLFNLIKENMDEKSINKMKTEVSNLASGLSVDLDTISNDINFLFNGLNNIKKEIQTLETLEKNESIENYSNNLINFAGEAIDEMESIGNLFGEVKKNYEEICEKFGEKKTAKPKEIFDPIYNFLKYFM